MKQTVIVTYKNGSSVTIDVPNTYYQDKYKKKPEKKIHQIFIKEYKKFVKALNKNFPVVDVNNYLSFSHASISGQEVLSVDIKVTEDNSVLQQSEQTVFVPGVHDQTFLNIKDTSLEKVLAQIEEYELIENTAKLIQKINSYFTKSNVEFTIKAGKKSTSTTSRKKKIEPVVLETEQTSDQ